MKNTFTSILITTYFILTTVCLAKAQYDYTLASNNPFSLVTLGNYATPTLGDIDADGDLDLFVGQVNSNTMLFYRNIGTAQASEYEAQTGENNPLNIYSNNSGCNAPVLVDIDGDNDLDAFVGIWFNTIKYYKNEGDSASSNFMLQTGTDNPLDDVFTQGLCSYASFVDIDGDQDFDAFITDDSGNIEFYKNTGDQNNPAFLKEEANNPLDNVPLTARTKIAFHDVNENGIIDAVIGHDLSTPELLYYENTGTADNAIFEEKTGNDNPFVNISGPTSVVPVFADIDMDGDKDLILGTLGSVQLYEAVEATTSIFDQNVTADVLVYPNPAINVLHLSTSESHHYEIWTTSGTLVNAGLTQGHVDVSSFPSGVYLLRLVMDQESQLIRFVK